MSTVDTIQIPATPELRKQLEEAAAKLNLSLSAYVLYLHTRVQPGVESARVDRHVRDVFGKHGDLMRRLSK